MKRRKIFAIIPIIIALSLVVKFLTEIEFASGFETYFKAEYYNQFGPLAISAELLIAGI